MVCSLLLKLIDSVSLQALSLLNFILVLRLVDAITSPRIPASLHLRNLDLIAQLSFDISFLFFFELLKDGVGIFCYEQLVEGFFIVVYKFLWVNVEVR